MKFVIRVIPLLIYLNNYLCPPYPDCIEVDIENHELANCNDVVELWGEYSSIDYTTEINLPSAGLMGEIPIRNRKFD